MDPYQIILLVVLFFIAATLYSSVGHAGASAYIAAMILVGIAPEMMKPTAFVLNIFVGSLVTYRFTKHGHFNWKLFWPFACTSIPSAFLTSYASIPIDWFKVGLTIILILGAIRLALINENSKPLINLPFSIPLALFIGALIGGLSGLTGTGGGIFLSPIILFVGWANLPTTAGVSAAFILVNSISGLAGSIASTHFLPWAICIWVPVVVAGGYLGSHLGIKKLSPKIFLRLLAFVMLIAAFKLITR